ncbi:hypothetical protein IWW55_005553, partial [Coemansia sp. RSA 2706]
MTTFQQKSVFVNAALALIALTYIYRAEDNVIVMDENNNLQVLRLVELDCSSNTLVPFTQEFRVHGFDIYWD